jgi:predicted nucleotide-binding protein
VGIKDDGEALLKGLVEWDENSGHTRVSCEELHQRSVSGWPVTRFNDAVNWLLKKNYIEDDPTLGSAPYEMNSIAITMEGRLAAESFEPVVDVDAVSAMNRGARRLLVALHRAYVQTKGASFSLSFGPEPEKETGLDFPGFRQAGQRLHDRGLARWAGHAALTSTPRGVDVAEDPAQVALELPLPGDDPEEADEDNAMDNADKKKVFVIHGRCEAARQEMGVFLRSLGLEPLWFRDVRSRMGGTTHVIRVVEQGMKEAHGIIALITPDEYSTLRPAMRKAGDGGEMVARWQARPNVLFEAGMAYMRHPDRVAFVLFGDAKLFSDTSGMCVYWPTNEYDPDSHRTQFRDLLGGGMQCEINASNDWMNSGDFDAVIRGLSGVSPTDPFR